MPLIWSFRGRSLSLPFYFLSASMAPRNYVNAGLAFIWIRLFIELWTMEKQLSVVSYLLLTGVGSLLGGELWLLK